MANYPEGQAWEQGNYLDQSTAPTYDDGGMYNPSQALKFQWFNESSTAYYPPESYTTQYSEQGSYAYNSSGFTPPTDYDNEPPLLEELEIYPKRILEKSLAVLNVRQSVSSVIDDADYFFKEADLAGPVGFCLMLAANLVLSGKNAQFDYIYGLSLMSVGIMYCLITLMSNSTHHYVTLMAVASTLGYSLLPLVALSIGGIVLQLDTVYGWLLTGASIALSSLSASRIFCAMSGDPAQRYLFAYPCALVYITFSLLVLF